MTNTVGVMLSYLCCLTAQVAFPSSTVPLQIFEARYRVLFSTLLAGDDKCVTLRRYWPLFCFRGYYDSLAQPALSAPMRC